VLPNADGFLKPGLIGRMQIAGSAAYQALLVPESAIVTDRARRLIYVVDGEGKVAARAVELGPLVGQLRVISGGITADDLVIISGVQRAQPGAPVTATPGKIEQAPAAAGAPPETRTPRASTAEIVGSARN